MEDLSPNDGNGLDYAILESLHSYGEPMGSGTLHYALRKQGSTPSVPTIASAYLPKPHILSTVSTLITAQ